MSVIEGVGDEVVIVTSLLLMLTIILTVLCSRDFTSGSITSLWAWALARHHQQRDADNAENSSSAAHGDQNVSRESGEELHQNPSTTSDNVEHCNGVTNPGDCRDGTDAPLSEVPTNVNGERTTQGDIASEEVESHEEIGRADTTTEEDTVHNAENFMPPNTIRVRLKYLNDTERTVITKVCDTVETFKRSNFADDLASNKVVRLIFNGQLLRNEATLADHGIVNGTVIHVHISQAQAPPSTALNSNSDLDISTLLWPLLSVILGICWISYIRYPELFNAPSIILLIAFSVSFLVIYVHLQVQLS